MNGKSHSDTQQGASDLEQPKSYWQHENKPEQQKQNPGVLRTLLEFALALVIALALTWAIKTFLVEPFEVPSGSMETTIMTNDKILADKISYNFTPIVKGDIIVFADKAVQDRTLVKRVIATGGQTVDFRNGIVYVDGIPLYEPYTNGANNAPLNQHLNNMSIEYPFEVPEGQLWVMGDNRENSADSRYFGAITETSVYGKAIMVFWPIEHIGPLVRQYFLIGD
ncbi:signal peptidase I [Actinomycetota bacterium]|nr:signal peptidase I [Actinomycetota bacterium]